MIERHITFAVKEDRIEEFERFIAEEYRPPVLKMPGLIECSLLRKVDDAAHYQMVFRWGTADQATAWRTSEVHQQLQPALNELHSGMEIVAYERRIG